MLRIDHHIILRNMRDLILTLSCCQLKNRQLASICNLHSDHLRFSQLSIGHNNQEVLYIPHGLERKYLTILSRSTDNDSITLSVPRPGEVCHIFLIEPCGICFNTRTVTQGMRSLVVGENTAQQIVRLSAELTNGMALLSHEY